METEKTAIKCAVCFGKKWIKNLSDDKAEGKIACPACNANALEKVVDKAVDALTNAAPEDLAEMAALGRRSMEELQIAETLPDGFELKDTYDVTCPYCKKGLRVRPSLSFQVGFNHGGGRCPGCSEHFQIRLDTRDNTAIGICMEVPGA